MKKTVWLLMGILFMTNVCMATGIITGTIKIVTANMPKKAKLPEGYHITLDPHTPADAPNFFITDEDVTSWRAGDEITVMQPSSTYSCESKDSDSVLINSTRTEWVCAIAEGMAQ